MKEIEKFEYIDNDFYKEIKTIIEESRKRIYRNINTEMVLAYWQIGRMIVEKQGGESRANYGEGIIKELSTRLTKYFGKGFTINNLRYMRQFYLTFKNATY